MDTSSEPVEPQSLHKLRALIPPRLFHRHTMRSANVLLRDLTMAIALASIVSRFDSTLDSIWWSSVPKIPIRACIWFTYWWFQGLVFTGIWVIGHECNHGAFSSSRLVCDLVGFMCHTVLWTPYFSWKFTHQSHHRHHASMEKDEHFVPRTRSELGIPHDHQSDAKSTHSYFEDTPIITVIRLLMQQFLGFPSYLLMNMSGRPRLPRFTSHFNPYSTSLFKPSQRMHIIISNIGIFSMGYLVYICASCFGTWQVLKFYGIPCIAVCHWVTMIVFLQHVDPRLPRYRKGAWNFRLGALSTMDRDFLGWQGRFFLHDIAHFHVAHHLFPTMPFYHTEEATNILRRALGDEYHSSSEPVFKCLWENFNKCQFVEDEDEVLYFKDNYGHNSVVGWVFIADNIS